MDTKENTGYRASHIERGEDYHIKFQKGKFRSAMWELEKNALLRLLTEWGLDGSKHVLLDFACGTGRILSFLEDKFKRADGVDVSESMISVAHGNVMKSNLSVGDITVETDLVPGPYDVVTAFRFFPNAEHPLKKEAMGSIARRISDTGLFIFNNHRNYDSLTYRVMRLMGKESGSFGWSDKDIVELVNGSGFKIVKRVPIGFIPAGDRIILLPISVWKFIEMGLVKFEKYFKFAQNIIYVCRKK